MRTLTIVAALVTAFALVGAGCGGDNEATGDTDTVVVTDTTGADDTTTDDETTGETETDDSGGLASGDCREFASASAELSQAFATAGSSGDLGDSADLFDELADQAPDEIRDDFKVLADAYGAYVDAIGDIGLEPNETPTAEQIAQLQGALASLDQQGVAAASERISAWAATNCPTG